MMQWSVYSRICNGTDAVEMHKRRLKNNLPPYGSIRTLTLTEKQFESIDVLLGIRKSSEITSKDLTSIF